MVGYLPNDQTINGAYDFAPVRQLREIKSKRHMKLRIGALLHHNKCITNQLLLWPQSFSAHLFSWDGAFKLPSVPKHKEPVSARTMTSYQLWNPFWTAKRSLDRILPRSLAKFFNVEGEVCWKLYVNVFRSSLPMWGSEAINQLVYLYVSVIARDNHSSSTSRQGHGHGHGHVHSCIHNNHQQMTANQVIASVIVDMEKDGDGAVTQAEVMAEFVTKYDHDGKGETIWCSELGEGWGWRLELGVGRKLCLLILKYLFNFDNAGLQYYFLIFTK